MDDFNNWQVVSRNLGLINAVNSALIQGMTKNQAIQDNAIKFGFTEKMTTQLVKEWSCYLIDCID